MLPWAVGLTTVPERRATYLPRTLTSLKAAGFPEPRLFVDGGTEDGYGALEVSQRKPRVLAYANWWMGLQELFCRHPSCDRFLMVQDDVLFCRNVRGYLDSCPYPTGGSDRHPREKGYWNLYNTPRREVLGQQGWNPAPLTGWRFQGALALAFDRDTVVDLLTHRHMVERPLDANRGTCNIDGGVGAAMEKCGRGELIHMPSLVQHLGDVTTLRKVSPKLSYSESFRGEEWVAGSI